MNKQTNRTLFGLIISSCRFVLRALLARINLFKLLDFTLIVYSLGTFHILYIHAENVAESAGDFSKTA